MSPQSAPVGLVERLQRLEDAPLAPSYCNAARDARIALLSIRSQTIEECAEVAENFRDSNPWPTVYAAIGSHIRALEGGSPGPAPLAVKTGEIGPYKGPITIDAGLLHALWCYGNLHRVDGVVEVYGTHKKALEDADRALFERAQHLSDSASGRGQPSPEYVAGQRDMREACKRAAKTCSIRYAPQNYSGRIERQIDIARDDIVAAIDSLIGGA